MKKIFGILIVCGVVVMPASAVTGGTPFTKPEKLVESRKDVTPIGSLRHRHRHCHIVVTFGHVRKRCHTHRHNKIAHHGPRYH